MDSPYVKFSYGDRSYCRTLDKIDTASICSELGIDGSLQCEVSTITSYDKGEYEIFVSGIKVRTSYDVIEAIHCYVMAIWIVPSIITLLDFISNMRRDYAYITSRKGDCCSINNPYVANAINRATLLSCDISAMVLFFSAEDKCTFGLYSKHRWFEFKTVDEVPITTNMVISAIESQQLLPVAGVSLEGIIYEVRFNEKLPFEYIADKMILSVDRYIAASRISKSARKVGYMPCE